jgi:hypothetical protein
LKIKFVQVEVEVAVDKEMYVVNSSNFRECVILEREMQPGSIHLSWAIACPVLGRFVQGHQGSDARTATVDRSWKRLAMAGIGPQVNEIAEPSTPCQSHATMASHGCRSKTVVI